MFISERLVNTSGRNGFTGIPWEARFWSKVNVDPAGCWVWEGSCHHEWGYGHFRDNGSTKGAHIVAYERYVGPVPEGHELHHKCENPACVRPDHLIPVTDKEHSALTSNGLGHHYASRTHCKNGHPFSFENTYQRKTAGSNCRRCKACQKAATRQWRDKRKASQ